MFHTPRPTLASSGQTKITDIGGGLFKIARTLRRELRLPFGRAGERRTSQANDSAGALLTLAELKMFKCCKQVLGAFGAALLFGFAPANAMPINGAVTVSDTFNPAFLPCPGGGIVRNCTSVEHLGAGNTGGATLDFVGSTGVGNATLLDWVFATPGLLANEITIPGFAFDIVSAGPNIQDPLLCGTGACADALTIVISGIVTGAGFDPAAFTGTLTLAGACNGATIEGNCDPAAIYSGGYSYSLAVLRAAPEPGTLLLVAIAGLGFMRRRSS